MYELAAEAVLVWLLYVKAQVCNDWIAMRAISVAIDTSHQGWQDQYKPGQGRPKPPH